jgi:hypothetical protein
MYSRFLEQIRKTRAERMQKTKEKSELSLVLERLDELENRLANIETILLEQEKVREFDRALR